MYVELDIFGVIQGNVCQAGNVFNVFYGGRFGSVKHCYVYLLNIYLFLYKHA